MFVKVVVAFETGGMVKYWLVGLEAPSSLVVDGKAVNSQQPQPPTSKKSKKVVKSGAFPSLPHPGGSFWVVAGVAGGASRLWLVKLQGRTGQGWEFEAVRGQSFGSVFDDILEGEGALKEHFSGLRQQSLG